MGDEVELGDLVAVATVHNYTPSLYVGLVSNKTTAKITINVLHASYKKDVGGTRSIYTKNCLILVKAGDDV